MKTHFVLNHILIVFVLILGACSGGQQQTDPDLETEQDDQDYPGDDGDGGDNNYDGDDDYGDDDYDGNDNYGGGNLDNTAGNSYNEPTGNNATAANAASGGSGNGINNISGIVDAASQSNPYQTPGENDPYATDNPEPNIASEVPVNSVPVDVGPVGAEGRTVRFVAQEATPVFSSPGQGSQIAYLNAGDVLVITIENGWGKIDDQHWISSEYLSQTAVPRTPGGNPWR